MIELVNDFFRQGGYAFYVWGAFGVTFLLLVAEVLTLRTSRRTILRRVGRLARLRGMQARSPRGAAGGADFPSIPSDIQPSIHPSVPPSVKDRKQAVGSTTGDLK